MPKYIAALLVGILCSTLLQQAISKQTTIPLVGIVSQPFVFGPNADNALNYPGTGLVYNYILGAYEKYVKSTGAHAVSVHFDAPPNRLVEMLSQLDGIIIPGGVIGQTDDDQLTDTIRFIVNWAKKRNDSGKRFFIHAICKGMEKLLEVESKDSSMIKCGYEHYSQSSVVINDEALASTSYLKTLGMETIKSSLETNNVMFTHNCSVSESDFQANKYLSQRYHLVGISQKKPEDRRFVALVENKDYPFLGMQFHPEEAIFKKAREPINMERTTMALHRNFLAKLLPASDTSKSPEELPLYIQLNLMWKDIPVVQMGMVNGGLYLYKRPGVQRTTTN